MADNKIVVDMSNVQNDVDKLLNSKFNDLALIKNNIIVAEEKANQTRQYALSAKKNKKNIFDNGKSIDVVNNIIVDLAENQVQSAGIQQQIMKYQQRQAEMIKFILSLGTSNIANNRAVIKYLKDKLSNNDNRQFDEYEVNELLNVIEQLKAKEDIFAKQAKVMNKINVLEGEVTNQANKDEEHDASISELKDEVSLQSSKDEEHDASISELKEEVSSQSFKDEEHDASISELKNVMSLQSYKDDEHDASISVLKGHISSQANKDALHDSLINELQTKVLKLEDSNKKLFITTSITLTIAIVSFILALVSLLI